MADKKITDLVALTVPADGDLLEVVDISEAAAADQNKKITVANLLKLENSNSNLGADVAMADANVWYDGPSLSLGAGTWMVIAQVSFLKTTTTAPRFSARLTDKTNHYASGKGVSISSTTMHETVTLATIIVLGSTTTVFVQGASTVTSSAQHIVAAIPDHGSGNNATQISAVRVA